MNTREIAAEYRLAHWGQVMQERAQSGLTIKAYCKELGICGNTYYYWQRRVRAAAATELGLCVDSKSSLPATSFREVQLVKQAENSEVTEMTAPSQLHIWAGELQLTVDSRYPVEHLAQLLHALSHPC